MALGRIEEDESDLDLDTNEQKVDVYPMDDAVEHGLMTLSFSVWFLLSTRVRVELDMKKEEKSREMYATKPIDESANDEVHNDF